MTTTRRGFLTAGLAGAAVVFSTRALYAQGQPTLEEVFEDPVGPVLGAPSGDVAIVEYFDYQCPYCKSAHVVLMDALAADPGLKLLPKDWPIFGAPSIHASQRALGALALGRYETAHEALMATQGRLSESKVDEALAGAGLDPEALGAAYAAERAKFDGFLSRNAQQATALGFRGTPAFVIGTTLYPGALDAEMLKRAIERAREA